MRETKLVQIFRNLLKFNVWATADWHKGNRYHNQEKLEEDLKWFGEHRKNTGMLLLGDLTECKTSKSAGGTADQIINIQKQKEEVLNYLKPFKENIIGFVTGNHEEGLWKQNGTDLTKDLARELGAPYLGGAGFIDIKVGEYHYIIYAIHGSGASRFKSSRLSWIMKRAIDVEADLYICGHFHDTLYTSDRIQKINPRNKTIEFKERHFAITGSYLNYGGYAEKQQFPPGKIGSTKIILSGVKKDLRVQN